jgi:hypothetical protein
MNKTKKAGFNENILIQYNGRKILAKIKGPYSAESAF